MPTKLLAFVNQAYCAFLQVYPPAFRERFAIEMAQVFRSLYRQAYAESGTRGVLALWLSAIWDGTLAALYQWSLYLRKQRMGTMKIENADPRDGIAPLTHLQTVLAVLPFILFGIISILSKYQPYSILFRHGLSGHPHEVFYWIVLTGLAAGLLAGFPRWAYAYLGWVLLFIWWWSGTYINGYPVGAYGWIPFLGVIVIALLVRRSWQPLLNMLAGLWKDWTLLSLSIYILYAFVYMLHDSNHHPYLLGFMILNTLAISLGALGYYRAGSPLRRVLALSAGLLVAAILSGINEATWDFAAYYGLPEGSGGFNLLSMIFIAVLALVMLGNGMLARWRLSRSSSRSSS